MENYDSIPLWCDEMPRDLKKKLEADGPAAELFVVNPSAVPWKKRRKIENKLPKKKK